MQHTIYIYSFKVFWSIPFDVNLSLLTLLNWNCQWLIFHSLLRNIQLESI